MEDLLDYQQLPDFLKAAPEQKQQMNQRAWDLAQKQPGFPKDPGEQADLQARIFGAPILKERADAPIPLTTPPMSGLLNNELLNPLALPTQILEQQPEVKKAAEATLGKMAAERKPGGMLSAPNVGSLTGGLAGAMYGFPNPIAMALMGLAGAGTFSGAGRVGEILDRRVRGVSSEPEPQALPAPPVVNPSLLEDLGSVGEAASHGMGQQALADMTGYLSNLVIKSGVPFFSRWYAAQGPMREVASRNKITELPLSVEIDSPLAGRIANLEKNLPVGTQAAQRSEEVLRRQVQEAVPGTYQRMVGGPIPSTTEVGQTLQQQTEAKMQRLQGAMSGTARQAAGGAILPEEALGQEALAKATAIRQGGERAAASTTPAIGTPAATLGEGGLELREAREAGRTAASTKYGIPYNDIRDTLGDQKIPSPLTGQLQSDIRAVGQAVGAFQETPEQKLAGTTLREMQGKPVPMPSMSKGGATEEQQAGLSDLFAALQPKLGPAELTWNQRQTLISTARQVMRNASDRDAGLYHAAQNIVKTVQKDTQNFFEQYHPDLAEKLTKADADWYTYVIDPYAIAHEGNISNPVNKVLAFEQEASNIVNSLFSERSPTGIITPERIVMIKKATGDKFESGLATWNDDLFNRQARDPVTMKFDEPKFLKLTSPDRIPDATLKEMFTPAQMQIWKANRAQVLASAQDKIATLVEKLAPSQVVDNLIDAGMAPEQFTLARTMLGNDLFDNMFAAKLEKTVRTAATQPTSAKALGKVIDFLDGFSPSQKAQMIPPALTPKISAITAGYQKYLANTVVPAIQKGDTSQLVKELFSGTMSPERALAIKQVVGTDGAQKLLGSYLHQSATLTAVEKGQFNFDKMMGILDPNKLPPESLQILGGKAWADEINALHTQVLQNIYKYKVLQPANSLLSRAFGVGQLLSILPSLSHPMAPITAIGLPMVSSRLLSTPEGVRLLTQGLQTIPGAVDAAAWAAQVLPRVMSPIPGEPEGARLAKTPAERQTGISPAVSSSYQPQPMVNLPPLGTKVIGTTDEGRPVIQNPDGSVSSHRNVIMSDDKNNFYLIPTMYGGKEVSSDVAWSLALKNKFVDPDTGRKFPIFHSLQEAEQGEKILHDQMQQRMQDKGQIPQVARPSSPIPSSSPEVNDWIRQNLLKQSQPQRRP